ncbi:MAG TPA: alpha-L-fucosidase C-terminal domain-containing protein, partial [Puia sp.]|nr:alpha-L-fucosidase C-terminal domain-containing protein [Puia sp.]
NGVGIYNSKPMAPYYSDNVFFTQSNDDKNIYAFYLSDKDDVVLPSTVKINNLTIGKKMKIQILGFDDRIKWQQKGADLVISIPSKLQNKPVGHHAVVFRMAE